MICLTIASGYHFHDFLILQHKYQYLAIYGKQKKILLLKVIALEISIQIFVWIPFKNPGIAFFFLNAEAEFGENVRLPPPVTCHV